MARSAQGRSAITRVATAARGGARRLARAWQRSGGDQRAAALAALALLATMFLPWYQLTTLAVPGGRPVSGGQSLSAFQVFTFVEAATLLVVAAVVALLFARAERRDFHLPARDGTLLAAAGVWVCLLIFYRQLDQPEPTAGAQAAATVGVNWGIFLAFLAALVLTAAGVRMRAAAAGEREPPATRRRPDGPGRDESGPPTARTDVVPSRATPTGGQLSFDDAPEEPEPLRPGEARARDR
ncbi:MAG TPA: hypothetical protein VGV40_05675 [Solirubrobacteraceae bacterium]|nr:hypothetical protein [Solirubrobacteraceae bacterium]